MEFWKHAFGAWWFKRTQISLEKYEEDHQKSSREEIRKSLEEIRNEKTHENQKSPCEEIQKSLEEIQNQKSLEEIQKSHEETHDDAPR